MRDRQAASDLPPAVDVDQISYSYGQRPALQDVSFTATRHRIFGLLGPNGGGKTTLFRILCTLLVPQTGMASVAGVDVGKNPYQVRRVIGVVFQSNSLDLELTAEETLLYQGRLFGLHGKKLKDRVEELSVRFGLDERRTDRTRTLSGGLRRRLELAKGLLHRPQVLLLDEPTVGLDPGARRGFWDYLKVLRDQEQMSILLTTHLMEEAERCDELVFLSRGRVVASGSPSYLKEKIGGDVVVVQTKDPQDLSQRISERFSCSPEVVGGTVRLELPAGHEFVSQIMESYPHLIEAITVAKPTLEDVFIHQTGQRFWAENDAGEEG